MVAKTLPLPTLPPTPTSLWRGEFVFQQKSQILRVGRIQTPSFLDELKFLENYLLFFTIFLIIVAFPSLFVR